MLLSLEVLMMQTHLHLNTCVYPDLLMVPKDVNKKKSEMNFFQCFTKSNNHLIKLKELAHK